MFIVLAACTCQLSVVRCSFCHTPSPANINTTHMDRKPEANPRRANGVKLGQRGQQAGIARIDPHAYASPWKLTHTHAHTVGALILNLCQHNAALQTWVWPQQKTLIINTPDEDAGESAHLHLQLEFIYYFPFFFFFFSTISVIANVSVFDCEVRCIRNIPPRYTNPRPETHVFVRTHRWS